MPFADETTSPARWLLAVSELAGLFPIYWSVATAQRRERHTLITFCFLGSMLVSSLYHLQDSYPSLRPLLITPTQWRLGDLFFAQACVLVVFAFLVQIPSGPWSFTLNGYALMVLGALVIDDSPVAWQYHYLMGVGGGYLLVLCALRMQAAINKLNWIHLLLGVGWGTVALTLFLVANHAAAHVSYTVVHSLWHVAVRLSAGLFLMTHEREHTCWQRGACRECFEADRAKPAWDEVVFGPAESEDGIKEGEKVN